MRYDTKISTISNFLPTTKRAHQAQSKLVKTLQNIIISGKIQQTWKVIEK